MNKTHNIFFTTEKILPTSCLYMDANFLANPEIWTARYFGVNFERLFLELGKCS